MMVDALVFLSSWFLCSETVKLSSHSQSSLDALQQNGVIWLECTVHIYRERVVILHLENVFPKKNDLRIWKNHWLVRYT